jgi:ferrous-iron efflux pump FieF
VNAQFVLYRNAASASLFSLLAVVGAALSPIQWLDICFDVGGTAVIAVIIFFGMFTLVRQSLAALLDEALEEAFQLRVIRALAESFGDYTQIQRIRTRRSGSRIFVDLFLEFPETISAGELLERTCRIKNLVERLVPHSEAWVVPVSPPPSEP